MYDMTASRRVLETQRNPRDLPFPKNEPTGLCAHLESITYIIQVHMSIVITMADAPRRKIGCEYYTMRKTVTGLLQKMCLV
jgi:hypothetical protein